MYFPQVNPPFPFINMNPGQMILPALNTTVPTMTNDFFQKAMISRPQLSKPKVKRRQRISKKNPRCVSCANCKVDKSPLWRKGDNGRVLCNKCGLYWSRHGHDRPNTLERARRRSISTEKKIEKRPKINPKETLFGFADFQQSFIFPKTNVKLKPEKVDEKNKFMDLMFGKEFEISSELENGQFIVEEAEDELICKKRDRSLSTSLFLNDMVFNLPHGNVPSNPSNIQQWLGSVKQEKELSEEFVDLFEEENEEEEEKL